MEAGWLVPLGTVLSVGIAAVVTGIIRIGAARAKVLRDALEFQAAQLQAHHLEVEKLQRLYTDVLIRLATVESELKQCREENRLLRSNHRGFAP